MITFVTSEINKENQKPQPDEHDLRFLEKEVVAFTNEIEEILKNCKVVQTFWKIIKKVIILWEKMLEKSHQVERWDKYIYNLKRR